MCRLGGNEKFVCKRHELVNIFVCLILKPLILVRSQLQLHKWAHANVAWSCSLNHFLSLAKCLHIKIQNGASGILYAGVNFTVNCSRQPIDRCTVRCCVYKTAELSQRRPRDAPNIWVHWKVLRVLTTHPTTFPETCNGLLFRSILRMCVQNLKFVALPVPEITGGTQKNWAVSAYAHAPFSPKFLIGFCSHGPSEYIYQIWSS